MDHANIQAAQNLGLLEPANSMTTRLSSGHKPIHAASRSRLLLYGS